MAEARENFQLYEGNGSTIEARGITLPPFRPIRNISDPTLYVASKALRDAVNVALALGQPLLVTGEPGTGKTQLAGSIAHELGLPPPLVFNTKTTSTARDIFYRYDALRHFRDANTRADSSGLDAEDYITYEALGLAVLLSMQPDAAARFLPEHLRQVRHPVRSVVLIDEIDKAPRDLPNDILNELDTFSFEVKETGRVFHAPVDFRPIVVLTSNSEKDLPEAFLRRCIYHNIEFPDHEQLRLIVIKRIGVDPAHTPARLEAAIRHFEEIRGLELRKRPSTAELLAWLRVLEKMDIDVSNLTANQQDALAATYQILVKTQEDLHIVHAHMLPQPRE